jgi:hypothetical protein
MYISINGGGASSIGGFSNGNTVILESNPTINLITIYKLASGTQSVISSTNLIIQTATINFHEYGSPGSGYNISSINFYTSGPSSFIPYTTQSAGSTTPNPGTTGKFTINGTNLYVWNGSLWVSFTGSSS